MKLFPFIWDFNYLYLQNIKLFRSQSMSGYFTDIEGIEYLLNFYHKRSLTHNEKYLLRSINDKYKLPFSQNTIEEYKATYQIIDQPSIKILNLITSMNIDSSTVEATIDTMQKFSEAAKANKFKVIMPTIQDPNNIIHPNLLETKAVGIIFNPGVVRYVDNNTYVENLALVDREEF